MCCLETREETKIEGQRTEVTEKPKFSLHLLPLMIVIMIQWYVLLRNANPGDFECKKTMLFTLASKGVPTG